MNMVELAEEYASKTLGRGGRVGMLASPAVRRTGLFDTLLNARGISVVWPEKEDRLLAAIREIKVDGPSQNARRILLEASNGLATKGTGLQFVACSEFSLIADSVAPGVNAVDTVDLLTEAIVAFHRNSG